jgi:hypothetical protein
MIFFTTGFGLLLHIIFWGVGLALLLTPRRWERYALLFAPAAGLALQSAVVWWGATLDLVGTDSYAAVSELLPVLLLVAGVWRKGRDKCGELAAGLRKSAGVWLAMVVVLSALLYPMAQSSRTLTTSSLGSCDAADYAAGARVFQEFARSERGGFIGLSEVVRVGTTDNFFDFWMRLNHFTPAALVAFNNSVFSLEVHETVGVMTAVFVSLTLPVVFWLARAGLRLGPAGAVAVAFIYGMSPVVWYAVYHVAMAQLLAAMAIALLTWCGLVLWRTGAGWRHGWRMTGLLATAYWLLLGSYNFILVVALVPAVAYVGGGFLRAWNWSMLGRWIVSMTAPLLLAALAFHGRASGLWERLQLLNKTDFGWKIPVLTPEGWLGFVADERLQSYEGVARWLLCGGVLAILAVSLVRSARRRERGVWAAACLSVPILAGYGYLQWRGAVHGTNASYDAYKLLSVFYPGILAVMCWWLKGERSASAWQRGAVGVLLALVLAAEAHAAWRFNQRMRRPPLMVNGALLQVKEAERFPEITSLNMLPVDDWSRLWANVFLLRKSQHFAVNTYEGRLRGDLRGEWDLLFGVLSIRTPDASVDVRNLLARAEIGKRRAEESLSGEHLRPKEEPLSLLSFVDTRGEYFIRAKLDSGWYGEEQIARAGERWSWTKEVAAVQIVNPQRRPLAVGLRIRARSLVDRELQIWVNGRLLRTAKVGTRLETLSFDDLEFVPGETRMELRSDRPPLSAGGDERLLGFAIYGLELRVQPNAEGEKS